MKKIIQTDAAPRAIGPYSQGVICGGTLYLSGQIALTPNGEEYTDQPAEVQARQVMENIRTLLQAVGREFCHIVKTTVFLTDMEDFIAVNEVYGSYFCNEPPARSTVAVHALPKGAKVEIECVVDMT